jgi:hypothetical protein
MLLLATKLKNRFHAADVVHLKNISVNGDKRGCSGFIARGDAIVYVNTEVLGGGYLYRTAAHMKDFTGGANRYAKDLDSLVRGINELLHAQTIARRTGVPAGNLIVSFIGA